MSHTAYVLCALAVTAAMLFAEIISLRWRRVDALRRIKRLMQRSRTSNETAE
jgi:heme exporter protein CcmD